MESDKVDYWVELADYDLKTAKAMLDTKRFLYVGFMCHMVIEKVLKGYFVFLKGEAPPYTHNLLRLAKETNLQEEFSEDQLKLIETLQPLNLNTRYPTQKEKIMKQLNEKECKRIYSKSKELFEWITEKLNG